MEIGVIRWRVRMVGRFICAVGCLVIFSVVCSARQLSQGKAAPVQHQPGILAVDRTPVSAATLDALITQVAQQILQKHLKSVAVIGAAGPMPDVPTQFGLEFGDKFSAALAKQSSDFRVEDRAELREIVKKNRVSDVMVVSDGLANWVASKARVEGYVVVEFTRVASGGAEVLVTSYRTDKEDGDFLSSANTAMDLTLEQYTDGLRPIDSDWNKDNHTDDENLQLPRVRLPTCTWCPRPEYTQIGRKERAANEEVVLAVTVFPDGKAGDIAVIKSGRYGLTASMVETVVQTWKFKPVVDANGEPTSTRLHVQTVFQLF
jgi:Gram-negative bacterial TonB protein C-terminal